MMRILYRDEQGNVLTDLTVDKLSEMRKKETGLLWVDISQEPALDAEPVLSETFGFHPLAVDDALRESHVPKVDDWQNYLYIALRAVAYTGGDSEPLAIPELNVFLGPNYIVTYHKTPISALDQVWAICQVDQRWLRRGAGHLLYRVVDQLVSEAIASEEQMRDDLEQLENQIFNEVRPETLERLFTLKRNILQFRRIVVPSRDVLNKLSRNEYTVTDANDRIFFRDVYDHFIQMDTLLEDMIILVGGALDAYLSVVNNRMNDVMKTLTVITAFFLPLTFITGFFGMNFFQATVYQHAWTGTGALAGVLALMLLIPLFMFWWARRRGWI